MKISEELKRRIKMLEAEQDKQAEDLTSLEQLRDLASIEELEQELASIDQDMPVSSKARQAAQKDIDLHKEELLEENVDLDAPLVKIEEEHDIDLSLEGLGRDHKKAHVQQGYVVCLMFNISAPSEWSEDAGGGWRGKGMGTSYANQADAEKLLQQLKQKWPEYPIELHRVS